MTTSLRVFASTMTRSGKEPWPPVRRSPTAWKPRDCPQQPWRGGSGAVLNVSLRSRFGSSCLPAYPETQQPQRDRLRTRKGRLFVLTEKKSTIGAAGD